MNSLRAAAVLGLLLVFPAAAHAQEVSPPSVPTEEPGISSPGLIAGGSALLTAGLASVPIGSLLYMVTTAPMLPVCASECPSAGVPGEPAYPALSIALIVSGGLSVVGGISMIVLGSQEAPDLSVGVGPGGATTTVRF